MAKYILKSKCMTNNVLQIAHRGNSKYYKDNSKNSIKSAITEGFKMVEIDIQSCKSGEIIVYHDTYLQDSMIENMTYSEILAIDNDIIKFKDVFDIPEISTVELYLDLKGDIQLVNALCKFFKSEITNKIKMELINIASFNMEHIKYLHHHFPNIKYGFITGNNFQSHIYYYIIREHYIKFFSICWTMLDHHICNILHGKGIEIYTYTCENNTILRKMLEYNIDGIVTNYKFRV